MILYTSIIRSKAGEGMTQTGKISVLMGVYNCEATLAQAIDSLLAQTYPHWELILCDDASTDNTYAVAEEYAARYPEKVRLLRNENHSFLAYSLNRCLEKASGEFVARMDGDDRSLPERFEKQVAFLNEHPEIAIVGTAMRRFDDKGELGAVIQLEETPDRNTPHRGNVFLHATVLGRKEVFEALGGYAVLPRTQRGQDLDLWFRFLDAGYQGANLPEVLYLVRENDKALRRRTAHIRWINFQTTLYGYRLLEYPWYWYWKPFVSLLKMLVPIGLIGWLRKQQNR